MSKRNEYIPKPHPVTTGLLKEWLTVRAEIAELDRQMHPDITDEMGRVWTWRWDDSYGSHYKHCGRLVPAEMIPQMGTATEAMLGNQNYDLCEVCLDGRPRTVTPCKPEWNCKHRVCAEMNS